MTKKKNVLFFFTDDQRFNTIGALNNSEIKTPNIDQLVKTGTSFTQAHIPGGTVGAVCMPSRAMLNTGRTLFHLQEDGSSIPSEHALLGETFKQAGYRAFGTGKWHNGTEAYTRSFTDGDEIFFGGMHDHWNVPAYHYDPTGRYEKTSKQVRNFFFERDLTINRCDHITPGKHSSELFCDVASEWINNYNDDKPFYMYISFMAPHDPRTMPEEFLNMYNPDEVSIPENFCEEHLFDYGIRNVRDEVLAPYPRTEKEVKQHLTEYYGMISHLDNELGKVIQTLKDKGMYEDTLIIFAADNGLALGQHGLFGKQSAYEHSIRVPLVFSGEGIPQNQQCDSYVYLMDIYPTLCELLGFDIPESVEGKSFAPCFNDNTYKIREKLYFTYAELLRAVKDNQYKYIEYRGETGTYKQLFDINNDPMELKNLIDEPSMQSKVGQLVSDLHKFKETWEDTNHPKTIAYWG